MTEVEFFGRRFEDNLAGFLEQAIQDRRKNPDRLPTIAECQAALYELQLRAAER